jgi:hypothetical protein
MVVVAVELEQLDVVREREHGRSGRLDQLDDVDQPFLEAGAVGHQEICILHRLGLSR